MVVNTILFIYWLIRLRYWLWIPLTGLIVNYEYITSMYQIYNPTKYANENRLKVVTYNVHSFGNEITGFSAKEFAEMMNKEETDVLCFQEYRGNGDFTEQDLQNTYCLLYTSLLFVPERKGKTAAMNRGMGFVTTPLVIFTDANTFINPQAVREIVKCFNHPQVGCVAGEKRVDMYSTEGAVSGGEGLYWKYESWLKKMDYQLYSCLLYTSYIRPTYHSDIQWS